MEIRNSNEDRVMSQSQYYKSRFDRIRESKWFPLTVVTVCVLGFSGIVSYAYNQGTKANLKETAAPLVQADASSFKMKPLDEGGMEIPFQDSLVYEQLDSNSTGEEAESLLPPPEQPMERPETVQDTATQAVENATESVKETVAEAAVTTEQAAEDVKVTIGSGFTTETPKTPKAPAPVLAETKTKAVEAVETAKTETKELLQSSTAQDLSDIAPSATTPATAPTSYTSGTYRVQLGSFRDQAAADSAWKKFKKDFAPALDGVTSNVERADLGDKGVYYRVQGTNLSKTSAESVCSSINAAKSGACLVKK